ncbi:MAG: ABC transporter ATP-binding protein [Halanaerobiaceae bacterium]
MSEKDVLLKIEKLTRIFGQGENRIIAVDNISFEIGSNKIVSFVGQSGSGKTTMAKMLLNLLNPSSGKIYFHGKDIRGYSGKEKNKYWRHVQGIFQDPYASFNQFYKVEKILKDCYKLFARDISQAEKDENIKKALYSVNLDPEEVLGKYPFEMSGGQRQRIMIARAFLIKPEILIADEPTSMIDACSRANILDVLLNVQKEQNISIIFITHDMGLSYYASDRMYIMEKGRIVERGSVHDVVENPKDPYTQQLLSDVPVLNEEWI